MPNCDAQAAKVAEFATRKRLQGAIAAAIRYTTRKQAAGAKRQATTAAPPESHLSQFHEDSVEQCS